MLRFALLVPSLFLGICGFAGASLASPTGLETRCGWFDNPSPGNAWLHDRSGEWTVATQGNHQARGQWLPKFISGRWKRSGASNYGFGCACLTGRFATEDMSVIEIVSSRSRDLSACRSDPAISRIERDLR